MNRLAPPSIVDGNPYPPSSGPPVINVWYGDTQTFGQNGIPQQWVNILGDTSDFDQVAALTYTLNGGTPQTLGMGENTAPRLVEPGDYNAEIDYASLNPGTNTVSITATDYAGLQTTHNVTINYVSGQTWPLPYSINWSTANSIQSVAQIVDGIWAIQPDGTVRTLQIGYDRLIDFGDRNTWQSYTVTAPVTIHSFNPVGFAVGFVVGWQGHTTVQYGVALPDQPRTGHPFPGASTYTGPPTILGIGENTVDNPETILAEQATSLSLETQYMFKLQTQANSSGGTTYSFKVWPASQTEPATWTLQAAGELSTGSILLAAHQCDVSFGNVTVTTP